MMVVSRLRGRAVRRAPHDSAESGALSFSETVLKAGHHYVGSHRMAPIGYPNFSGGFPIRRDCVRWANDVTPTVCSMLMGKLQQKSSLSNSLVARTLTEKVHLAMFAPPYASRFRPDLKFCTYAAARSSF